MASHLVSTIVFQVAYLLKSCLFSGKHIRNRTGSCKLFFLLQSTFSSFFLSCMVSIYHIRLVHAATVTAARENTSNLHFHKQYCSQTSITTPRTTPYVSSPTESYRKDSTQCTKTFTANFPSLVIFWSYM